MQVCEAVELLTRRKAESDARFRAELDRLSRRGLKVIAGVEAGMSALAVAASSAGLPYPHEGGPAAWSIACFLTLAVAAYSASRVGSLARHARSMAWTIGLLTSVLISFVDLRALGQYPRVPVDLDLLTVLLVALATIPATPLQIFALGGLSLSFHVIIASLAVEWGWLASYQPLVLPLAGQVLLCTALAGANYGRIHGMWRAHEESLETAETARQSELRSCHAENAATTLRLAATLSHEFNSPLGTLKSCVETIRKTPGLLPSNGPLAQLSGAMAQAVGRLEEMVRRMQRFTNLDRADLQNIDLRQLIEDVIQLQTPPDGSGARFELDFQPVPRFQALAQPLTGMFSTLLRRAIDDAGPGGAIRVQADVRDSVLHVSIGHDGALSGSHDPEFTVRNGRVGTSNWDMFSTRQFIQSLGGELAVESAKGTHLEVTLPVKVIESAPGLTYPARAATMSK